LDCIDEYSLAILEETKKVWDDHWGQIYGTSYQPKIQQGTFRDNNADLTIAELMSEFIVPMLQPKPGQSAPLAVAQFFISILQAFHYNDAILLRTNFPEGLKTRHVDGFLQLL
jgi:hypothetical protein